MNISCILFLQGKELYPFLFRPLEWIVIPVVIGVVVAILAAILVLRRRSVFRKPCHIPEEQQSEQVEEMGVFVNFDK